MNEFQRRANGLGAGLPLPDGWNTSHEEEQRQRRLEAERLALEDAQRRARERESAEVKHRAEEREAEREARTQAAATDLKERLLARYLETPGATHAGFAAMWPRLLADHQYQETLHGEDPVEQTKRELATILRGVR